MLPAISCRPTQTQRMRDKAKTSCINCTGSKTPQQTRVINNFCFAKNHHRLSFCVRGNVRFGSWCYSGTVQLTPTLALADIPHVIPALRMQQSKLDFMCDVSQASESCGVPFKAWPKKQPYLGT